MMKPLPTGPAPVMISKPRLICSAPMPSEMAVPPSVTTIAKMSTIEPSQPSVRCPKMGVKIAEMSGERPVYQITRWDGARRAVYADDGSVLRGWT